MKLNQLQRDIVLETLQGTTRNCRHCGRVILGRRGYQCGSCVDKACRNKEPGLITRAYANLKASAKRRRKEFLLTKEEFAAFCERTQYHVLRGRSPNSLTVDRIDTNGPYAINNIRVLNHAANSTRDSVPYAEFMVDGKFDASAYFGWDMT
jgi:hypothetical protein